MTFSVKVKEEIAKSKVSHVDKIIELSSFLKYDAHFNNNTISLTIENASIARRIYQFIKEIYNIQIKITIRNQRRFRIKQIYILEIKEKVNQIKEDIKLNNDNLVLETKEEKISYICGLFLACGSISDPSTSGYHLEFLVTKKTDATTINNILNELSLNSKILKRNNKYMIYIKEAEKISDLLKMLNAINSLFAFEDIRIYRDHKNMVNRWNNCEIANQERVISTGLKQLENIEYLEKNNLLILLDEKTRIVIEYRKKYPETSYQELSNIISLESGYKIGKSGINHHFIKMNDLITKHKKTIK